MNIILLTKSGARPVSRQINTPFQFFLLFLLLIGFSASLLYLGYRVGTSHQPEEHFESLSVEMRAQRDHLERLQQEAKSEVDALTRRLGQMQAYLTRLDALGFRLVKMAKLDEQEFDFNKEPPMGGPEESAELPSHTLPELAMIADELQEQMALRQEKLSILERVLLNRNLRDEILPAGRPIKKGWMSSAYGMRNDPFTGKPQMHKGIDFAGKKGSSIYAVASGVVSWSGKRHGYGQLVEINHGNGYSTRYGHNAEVLVKEGELIKKGQEIAKMGSSGRSTGPHLHFELLKLGRQINPIKFIRSQRNAG